MAPLAPCPCSRCRFFVGWRLTPYPTYGPYHCELKLSTLSLPMATETAGVSDYRARISWVTPRLAHRYGSGTRPPDGGSAPLPPRRAGAPAR
ncbi:TPA: hypothetical protein MI731_18730 [Klebsiella pneumoniae]|nr:hypothetical protein [Klebsiella pneumoniae]HBX7090776.1 hypothetical protein [Klebsiella pneumoniae]HBX7259209.1 hypothetical protein [Klebsiella pneumoniae]HBX7582126.1 hypothetical protein [Klebsiella pneumoniae]HBX7938474.1 hypothetical protein [Klebsiella pneumoniae]